MIRLLASSLIIKILFAQKSVKRNIMTAVFLTAAIFPVASMARTTAAGSRKQDDNACQTKDEFHIFSYFVISSEGSSSGAIDSL